MSKHTWEYRETPNDSDFDGEIDGICAVYAGQYGPLIAAAPDLLAALEMAAELVKTARQYFPKSIKDAATFKLEATNAAITAAIAKATPTNAA